MRQSVSRALWLGLALLLAMLGMVARPAAAGPAATLCSGTLTATTVAGDLIVPEGVYCELDGSTVLGDVRVHRRSTLAVYDSQILGSLRADQFELVLLENASVGGRTRLSDGVSAWFEGATLAADVRLVNASDTRLLSTYITGKLVVSEARGQVQFCGSRVTGDARFAANEGIIQIGGDLASCAANEVRGNLRVAHNRQETIVANNTVGQNLVCAGNEPVPVVFGNQVAGKVRGQCGAGEPVDMTELNEQE